MSGDDHNNYTYMQFGNADYMIIRLPNKYRITVDDYNAFAEKLKSVSINIVHADIPHLNIHNTYPEELKDLPKTLDLSGLLVIRFVENGWVGNIFLIWSMIARLPSIDYLWVKRFEYLVMDKAKVYFITM